jgi:hypothetical protein
MADRTPALSCWRFCHSARAPALLCDLVEPASYDRTAEMRMIDDAIASPATSARNKQKLAAHRETILANQARPCWRSHSPFMFAALMMGHHFSISAF